MECQNCVSSLVNFLKSSNLFHYIVYYKGNFQFLHFLDIVMKFFRKQLSVRNLFKILCACFAVLLLDASLILVKFFLLVSIQVPYIKYLFNQRLKTTNWNFKLDNFQPILLTFHEENKNFNYQMILFSLLF